MENSRLLKIIVPGMCPHCQKEIIISQRLQTPFVEWVLKREDIESAKQTVRKEVINAKMDEGERKLVLNWVNNEETLFGPDEVKSILSQVLTNNEKKDAEPKS